MQTKLAWWLFSPADTRVGTWLRTVLGGLLLYAYWPMGRSHRYEGALGDGTAWRWLYDAVFLTPEYRWLMVFGIVVFALGWRPRLAGPVLALLLVPYCFLQSGQQSRQIWVACVICVSLMPSKTPWGGCDVGGPVWPLRLLQLQLTMVYGSNAFYKSTAAFLSGDVLTVLSTRPNFLMNLSEGYLRVGGLAVPVAWLAMATVMIEYWLAVGLWWRRTMVFSVVLGVMFHVGLKFVMRIHMLDVASLFLYFAFLVPVTMAECRPARSHFADYVSMIARRVWRWMARPAVLHGREVRKNSERLTVTARLERGGETRIVCVSAPIWTEAWIDESYDALTLAALPWAEREGVTLRVRGVVSAGLLAGLRRRRWLRGKRGVTVRADTVAQPATERREHAVLHYTGDVFSMASAVELAQGHELYPRPELAVGAGALPGGEAGRVFLEKLGLRYAEVRIERPGPESASGGEIDGAVRLRILSQGFGTGYLPATAAYRYAQPEAGEPDPDLDPLFSGGGMRVVHHGAQRALPGTLAALRGVDAMPAPVAARSPERAPQPLVDAGLALMRKDGTGFCGRLDFDLRRVRWHALDFLRWLRAEPDLAATPAGRALEAALRQGLGLSAEEALPKAEAHRSSLGAAARPPDARRNRWWPRRAEWEGGLALISDDRALVRMDLEPIASWLRLRNPLLPVGAERTLTLTKAVRGRGLKKPVFMVGMHPMPDWAQDVAEGRSGRVMTKSEELSGLERAGVAVPRWRVLRPGEKLTEGEFGRYVVVKPDQGLRGACVRVQKATSVRGEPIYVEAIKTSSAPLVQEFVYTGPRPVSHRVGVLFGKAIYRWRIEGREVEGRALPEDGDFRASSGVSVVSSGKDCTLSDPFDAEVIAFAENASRAFPEIPLMGIDVVRRVSDGKLFVLELNASGYCFHLTSATGVKMQKTTYLELPEQYGGYAYIADLYRLAHERVHGW